jgi:flagellar biosynthesis/type III secretory pathway M-ring protein FliF/YscJ
MAQRLPSLNALRAFEVVARHRSLSKAARELHVTPAAVSHQIKALEADLEREREEKERALAGAEERPGEIEAQVEAALAGKGGEGRRLPVLQRKASTFATKEPENTAKLLRSWMAEPER